MSDWRALKAARERREAKRLAIALERQRETLRRVARERDEAVNGPLNSLSRGAMEILTHRLSHAIEHASEQRLEEALKRIQQTGFCSMKVGQRPYLGMVDDVVLTVDIPASRYHLMADLPSLRWMR